MKKKLSILAFGLLLAVGWTNVAQAQRSNESPSTDRTLKAMSSANVDMNRTVMAGGEIDMKDIVGNAGWLMAPRRATYNQTADATHVYDWYDAKTYTWSDGNGTYTAKYTDPATNPYQIAYLLGSTYMNPEMPGIKYSGSWGIDHPYYNIDFGWDIPANARWDFPTVNKTTYSNIVISTGTSNSTSTSYARIVSMRILSGNDVISSWDYATNGTTLPQGWNLAGSWSIDSEGRLYTSSSSNYLTFPGEILVGLSNVTVEIVAYDYSYSTSGYRRIYVNNSYKNITQSTNQTLTWNISSSGTSASVTPPYENGYTVLLVKVKDYDISNKAPQSTSSWSALINYFTNYIDEVVLLTDGMRVEEGEADAGTVFTYSGILNRFYFIGKGKNSFISSSSSSSAYDLAPTYGMYEEFSPTTTAAGAEVTDFYSRMLEGESYDVVHDCQGVNYMQHFFSMSGNTGTDAKSLTNLIFYIPDNRAIYGDRNYDTEYLPQVGLYNITLTAQAKPVANYSSSNRYYDVTNDWVSSLNRILDFDVDQDYELWIWIYDNEGNPVAKEKVPGTDIFHNTLTYTYTVPQNPESYTIVYRVKGWPKDATNNPVNDPENGTFYTWSNLAEVVIPGYSEFLSVGLDHYESDFVINEEHNYYRNFLTVANQNPENQLTPNRVLAGENLFKLYRYEDSVENTKVKAADLRFYQSGNTIRYKIDYYGQNILSGYELPMTTPVRIDTAGVVAYLEGATTTTETYSYTFTSGQFSSNTTVALGGVNWTLAGSYTGNGYWGYNGTKGQQFGSGNAPYSNLTLTTSGIPGRITSVKVNASTANNGNATLNVTVGGNSFISGQALTSTATTYTGTGSASGNVVISLSQSSSVALYIKSIEITYEVTAKGPQQADRAYTLLDNQLNVANYTTGYVYPNAPWSVSGSQLRLQDNGCFYILAGSGLQFTMPSGYTNASVKFVAHVGNSGYYVGTFDYTTQVGVYSVSTSAQNTDYECIIPNVSSGDVITVNGTCLYNGNNYSYSPDFTTLYVYVEGGQGGQGGDEPLYLADIMFVDQFKAETKNDAHPRLYSYFLQFDNPETGEVAKSSPRNVPVQHTGATLGGYYTTEEIQGDTERELTMNVMNADVNMTLADNPAIYYYTLDRKPSTTPNADWLEISELQIRTNGTYQEIDELLTQYIEQTVVPGPVERYDNYNVQTGNYNSYMSYVPIVWTHGELQSNRRIKWDTERKHNSYGAPIWKTGVGDVHILSADSWRQQGAYGSTNWLDENNDSCSLYFLEIKAEGILPSNNTVGNENGYVPYVPYWFNVYATSASGQLRGYNQILNPGTDPENTGDPGSHLVNNPEKNRYIWRVYGGRTNDGYLEKNLSNTWAENFAFGALNNITDLQIIVRFYYVVNGMVQSTDFVMNRDDAPAGYGAESPGFSPEPHTGIIEVLKPNHGSVVSTTYVNPQGMQSDKPFDGVNIVITRYEDGTTSTNKVIR